MDNREIKKAERKFIAMISAVTVAVVLVLFFVWAVSKKYYPDFDVGAVFLLTIVVSGVFSAFFYLLSKFFLKKESNSEDSQSNQN